MYIVGLSHRWDAPGRKDNMEVIRTIINSNMFQIEYTQIKCMISFSFEIQSSMIISMLKLIILCYS